MRAIASVEEAGEAEMICIAVDADDGLFVIDGFVVTHNTVVAEFAIWQARQAGQRAIYTAPVKALSNQKYRDFAADYGEEVVGLLTGDIVENPGAPILVMTTEIYRNMLLEGSRVARQLSEANGEHEPTDVAELARRSRLDEELSGVGVVIFDELHFLGDPDRGPVWEEAIIHSPDHVLLVGLSATVSNLDELRDWITHVHGPTDLVVTTKRSVPLEHFYFLDNVLNLVRDASGKRVKFFPDIGGETKAARLQGRGRRYTAYEDAVNAATPDDRRGRARKQERDRERIQAERRTSGLGPTGKGPAPRQESEQIVREAPSPAEVLTALRKADLLPCLFFLPGRKAVEDAAQGAAGHLLVSAEQRGRLREEVRQWIEALPPDDRQLDQVNRLADLLPRGIGFHHAGILPGLKLLVESLFARGELKAVFSTDTLALGINMPARSVVVGSMSKFDGTQMRLLTPNEYSQLTGRAGRRGKDEHGSAVIPYSPWDAFEPAFTELTGPMLPVTSAFTIRYNSVLNLWSSQDDRRLVTAVAASLREFQRNGRRQLKSEQWAAAQGKQASRPKAEITLGKQARRELMGTITVLRTLGYIGEDDQLTVRGRLLRALFSPPGIMLAELLLDGALDNLGPAEIAEVVSWFTYDNDRLRNTMTLPQKLQIVRRRVANVQRLVQDTEYDQDLAMTHGIEEAFHDVALSWYRGSSLQGITRRVDLAEGDILISLNQTIDLLQQLQASVGQALDAKELWAQMTPERKAQRARLESVRPALGQAWRGLLRGSVAQSRQLPTMAVVLPESEIDAAQPAGAIPLAATATEKAPASKASTAPAAKAPKPTRGGKTKPPAGPDTVPPARKGKGGWLRKR
ncbi:MAG TPA: DEAD/DEAH box helicase [Ktedonobacterales bacterium]